MSAFASTHAYAARSTSPPLLINRDLRWCEKAQVFDVRRQLQVWQVGAVKRKETAAVVFTPRGGERSRQREVTSPTAQTKG